MKQLLMFVIFCLCLGGLLAISPFETLFEGKKVLFSEHGGMKVVNNKIYLVCYERKNLSSQYYLSLSVSEDFGNTFTSTYLDSLQLMYSNSFLHKNIAPELDVSEDGTCHIYYIKRSVYDQQYVSPVPSYYTNQLYYLKYSSSKTITKRLISDEFKDIPLHHVYQNQAYLFKKDFLFKQLSYFMHFSKSERNTLYDASDLRSRESFTGKDKYLGPVYSQSDLWIKGNTEGSANPNAPGWPLFSDRVISSGRIRNYAQNELIENSSAPVTQIFQGDYQEEAELIEPEIDQIFLTALKPFGMSMGDFPNTIFNCEIMGSTLKIQVINFTQTRTDTFVVYQKYPDALHPTIFGQSDTYMCDSLWTNVVTIRDTVWGSPSNYSLGNQSIYLPGTVWIKGQVSGKMTVMAEGDVYITGNITYMNTPVGQMPINEYSSNQVDYFSLISLKNIYLKYKYREPITNGSPEYITHADNATGPDGHVWLYGAYAAGLWYDSGFSFEYQHPHGAVMPYRGISHKTGQDTLYSFIDFHRHRFPPINPSLTEEPLWKRWPNESPEVESNGYPNNSISEYDYTQNEGSILYKTSDYPWYNPVWPEKDAGPVPLNLNTDITWERGTVHLIGSLFQGKRGLLYRTGSADDPDVGHWDIGNGIFGPPHRPTGYQKDFRYDERFRNNVLKDFPVGFINKNNCTQMMMNVNTMSLDSLVVEDTHQVKQYLSTANDQYLVLVFNRNNSNQLVIKVSEDQGASFSSLSFEGMSIYQNLLDAEIINSVLKVLMINEQEQLYMLTYNFAVHAYTIQQLNLELNNLDPNLKIKMQRTNQNQLLLFVSRNDGHFIYRINDSNQVHLLDSFIYPNLKGLAFATDSNDSLYIVARTQAVNAYGELSSLHFAKGALNGITANDFPELDQSVGMTISTYPNPFNPETKISFNLAKKSKVCISIYNIKGQKVRRLLDQEYEPGSHSIVFDGKDDQGQGIASGIYFVRAENNDQRVMKKIMMIK